MTQVGKRRIQVASFSGGDISSIHRVSMFAGMVLIIGSAALAVASNSNARAAADAMGAARALTAISDHVLQGTQRYFGGGADRLGQAVGMSDSMNTAFSDVVGSASSLLVVPGVKGPASHAYNAWSHLNAALSQIAEPAAQAAELSEASGRALGNFATLVRKLDASGRSSAGPARAYESAVRLYTYAESGFGMASLPRVDYDLQVLMADLAGTDLRQDGLFLAPLGQSARMAVANKISKESLAGAHESATLAKSSAAGLAIAAGQTKGALWLGLLAAVLAIGGIGAIVSGLRGAAGEFSTRYNRSMLQFRGDESAREQLLADLAAVAGGHLSSPVTVPNGGEYAEIATQVNDVLMVVRERLSIGSAAMSAAMDAADTTGQLVLATLKSSEAVVHRLSISEARLLETARQSRSVALDSRVLVQAADEAVSRAADATRIAQDAASRLESMREGLQDTSKRIKRLGERSQEIDGVVDDMDLLSEQIGVLALNASMEAERAGEAGAGFRLVAKEVQALAVRSEDSLNRISALVQGVQADARSAAESVDRSTTQVVAGANVGSVSQALLSVLAPLAEGMGAMARSVAQASSENAMALAQSVHAASEVRAHVTEVIQHVDGLRTPLQFGHSQLDAGLHAVLGTHSNSAAI